MILPTTLTAAGLAALINIWLAIRCGQARGKSKVSIGDGGDDGVIRRMRAHSNFVEYTPIVVILIGVIELSLGDAPTWLWVVMGVYMLGRVAHGLGMDGVEPLAKGRAIGTITTMLVTLGLGLYALAMPHLSPNQIDSIQTEAVAEQ